MYVYDIKNDQINNSELVVFFLNRNLIMNQRFRWVFFGVSAFSWQITQVDQVGEMIINCTVKSLHSVDLSEVNSRVSDT